LGSTTTGYYGGLIYINDSSSTPTGALDLNTAQFTYGGGGNTNKNLINAEIHNPFSTKWTLFNCWTMSFSNFSTYSGELRDTTSYTSFTITPSSGTITGGNIRVYGYRNS
jgi:hypothetical protein